MNICGAMDPITGKLCLQSPKHGTSHSWEVRTRDDDLLQLAMFTHWRDARDENGPTGVKWEDIGPLGHEAYLKDAEAFLSAAELLGYHR